MSDDWPTLSKKDWDGNYQRLLLVAHGRLRRMIWRGRNDGTAPMGLVAEDFVLRAISESLTGTRAYDPTKSFFKNLCQLMSSDISNIVTSYENRYVEHADDDKIVNLSDYRSNPEDLAIKSKMVEHFLSYAKTRDAEAAQLSELILSGVAATAIELSNALGRSISDIENIKKRLRRLCQEYQIESDDRLTSSIALTNKGP